MKMSQLFGRTLRDQPSEADLISHVLLLQAGMIHQVSTGVYSYLPLAWKSIKKIESIIREEMDFAGAQEVKLGILQNREIFSFAFLSAGVFPENCLVGANSPNLCPTMSSDTVIGINFFPL